jgi:hypothetical protein
MASAEKTLALHWLQFETRMDTVENEKTGHANGVETNDTQN